MAEGVRRTGLSTARPLLAGVNPRATFKALLDARLPLYREVATVEVDTDKLEPPGIVDEVVVALESKLMSEPTAPRADPPGEPIHPGRAIPGRPASGWRPSGPTT